MEDNLEKYFKKHLSDETPAEDKWNVPSDKVWDNALPGFRTKKGLFIPWRYLFLAGFLIIIGAGIGTWLWISPGSSSEEILISEEMPVHQQQETMLKEEQRDEPTSVPVAETTEEPVAQIAVVKSYQDEILAERTEQEQTVIITNAIPEQRHTVYLTELTPKYIDHLNIMTEDELPVFHELDAPDPITIDLERKKPFNNKGKFGIGAYYAPTFYNTFVYGDTDYGIIETGNSYIYAGNYGAEIKYHISSRLSIHSGIARSNVKSWSRSEVDFAYDASTEHIMPGGEKENASAVPMLTPFGEVGTEITYRFPGDDEIPDGEPMNSILDTHQDIEYLSIPLGVEYNIIPFSYFNWFAEGGVRFNWASGDATDFSSRIIHHGHDMDVVEEIMTSHPTYNSNYFDFYLGTGLNYQFSKSLLVGGSIRYFRNINKVNVQENLSTNVRAVGLKLGIIYFF